MKFSHVLIMVILLVAAAVFTYWILTQIIVTFGGIGTLIAVCAIVIIAGIIYASQKEPK